MAGSRAARLVSALAVLLSTPLVAAPHATTLYVNFVGADWIPDKIVRDALAEAVQLWRRYEIELVQSTHPSAVQVTIDPGADRQPDVLGESRFRDGQPMPFIVIYYGAVIRAASKGNPFDLDVDSALPRVHDTAVARVLGRAVAHEIGHYLLRWQHHAQGGLMRATHRPSDLVAPRSAPFALSQTDIARLRASLGGPVLAGLRQSSVDSRQSAVDDAQPSAGPTLEPAAFVQ